MSRTLLKDHSIILEKMKNDILALQSDVGIHFGIDKLLII